MKSSSYCEGVEGGGGGCSDSQPQTDRFRAVGTKAKKT